MRREEVEEVYAIARQVFREEIKMAIKTIKEELKAKPVLVDKVEVPPAEEEVKEDA